MWRFVVSLCYCVALLSVVIFVLNPWVASHTDVLWVRCLFAVVFGAIAGDLGYYIARKISKEWD